MLIFCIFCIFSTMNEHDNENEKEKSAASSEVSINDTEIYQEAFYKMRTDEVKWSVIEFETDTEDNVERFKDLVPSAWISSNKKVCWYPMHDHKSTIKKLVKQCAQMNPKWNCFSMKIIEENIGTFFLRFCKIFLNLFFLKKCNNAIF